MGDMVEQLPSIYVKIVKAKGLPVKDISGTIDPYVEVEVGNYKQVTKHLENYQNPVWNSVFSFSKEKLLSNSIVVNVRDKDFITDDFVGRVLFDVTKVPILVRLESPLAPQWYGLEDKNGQKIKGEILLAVWIGIQAADEFCHEAWNSDAQTQSVGGESLADMQSKVYFSPTLYYLCIYVIDAEDLISSEKNKQPVASVKVQVGHQLKATRPTQVRTNNPMWNEKLFFVVAEPFAEYIIVSVEDEGELVGRLIIPVGQVPQRGELPVFPHSRRYSLPRVAQEKGEEEKKFIFAGKIRLRSWIDGGYHVLDESSTFSSDFQPASKNLRKPKIGILQLGILSARDLLPMKNNDGRTTDAYCVAKYGNKWVRTRTCLHTLTPRWDEQYTWEVYDPFTVITIGVFDNYHINGNKEDARDRSIGKVRIRLSTLETDRIYTHYYPLQVLQPSGLKKHGELHLVLQFTCTAWANMVAQYGRPLLPRMHYVQPISIRHIDWLRHQAMQIVAARLSRAEPPIRKETAEYMLDVNNHMFSLRKSKANLYRIISSLSGILAICRWFNQISHWKNPFITILVHVLFFVLIRYPVLMLPNIFLCLFVIGLWNYPFRPKHPLQLDARLSHAEDADEDELEEEFDTFPTSEPIDIVRVRYDRLRSVMGLCFSIVGDLATKGERALSIVSWRDPRATVISTIFALSCAVLLYVCPIQVAQLIGLYWLRHPLFRSKLPPVAVNFFNRLPAKSDMLL
ncbi:hypothetical protein ACH5RR_025577 [Cinchona calisaya]|uniref:C2 domain-containing protein n=1 Tax=Cinchona calisaya TaxID=153742 RepID=A0ABD2Z3E8_9GENT